MKKYLLRPIIYRLIEGENTIYVGSTWDEKTRRRHWSKQCPDASFEVIEEVKPAWQLVWREREWIRYYQREGAPLRNKLGLLRGVVDA
jgi:hypothetical protein